MVTLCHSVRSRRSPVALSLQPSLVAMRRPTTASPDLSCRTCGSAPRPPSRMTLLTLPAMTNPLHKRNPYAAHHAAHPWAGQLVGASTSGFQHVATQLPRYVLVLF